MGEAIGADRLRELVRASGIYAVGDLGIKAIGFLLYPVYAALLSPAEFGIVGLAGLVSGGMSNLFALGTRGAAFNFYHRYEGREREEFYTSLAAFVFVVSSVVLAITELTGPWLFRLVLGEDLYDPYLRIAVVTSAITATVQMIPQQRFKADERAGWYVLFSSGSGLVNHAASLVAVGVLSLGALGYVLGNLVGAVAVGAVGVVFLARWAVPSVSVEKVRAALAYSLPLFPHFYSHFVISLADRALLSQFLSLEAVGIYTVVYSLSEGLRALFTSLNNAVMPETARAAESEESARKLPRLMTYYVLTAGTLTVGFGLLGQPVLAVLLPASYRSGLGLVPWLSLAFFASALYYVPMNLLTQTERDTNWIPVATGLAAAVNIGVNVVLIPAYGILGAALSTLAAYAILGTSIYLVARRRVAFDYEARRLWTAIVCTAVAVCAGLLVPATTLVGVLARVGLVGSFPVALWILEVPTIGEREQILETVRGLLDRIG